MYISRESFQEMKDFLPHPASTTLNIHQSNRQLHIQHNLQLPSFIKMLQNALITVTAFLALASGTAAAPSKGPKPAADPGLTTKLRLADTYVWIKFCQY
jgi:hypothetical protein